MGKKVTNVPTKVSQKLALPQASWYMRPVSLGNQKYMPPRMGNTAAPKITKWKWATM